MTTVFWNGRNGYTVQSDGQYQHLDAFRYSRSGKLRCGSVTNDQKFVLAQFRPEMENERETLRRALMLLCGADRVWLYKDDT